LRTADKAERKRLIRRFEAHLFERDYAVPIL
jgi:hypothetical protein